jgi:hypothetical protein
VNHDDALRAIGTTTRATTDRIIQVWESANATNREDGAQWYPLNRQIILELAHDYYVDEATAAAVVAHLSPRVQWNRCLLGAAVLSGRRPVGIMGSTIARAQQALSSDDPLSTLKGPKTRNFAANLMGDLEAVTVDVWALRVAFGERDDLDKIIGRRGVYEATAHCYTLAARRIGVTPSTMQAATWCALRGRAV